MTTEPVSKCHNSISCLVKQQILLDVPFHITAPRGTCLEMVTGSKGSTNVMLVMVWVVGFVMDFVMT